jgi:hypothetical protein
MALLEICSEIGHALAAPRNKHKAGASRSQLAGKFLAKTRGRPGDQRALEKFGGFAHAGRFFC